MGSWFIHNYLLMVNTSVTPSWRLRHQLLHAKGHEMKCASFVCMTCIPYISPLNHDNTEINRKVRNSNLTRTLSLWILNQMHETWQICRRNSGHSCYSLGIANVGKHSSCHMLLTPAYNDRSHASRPYIWRPNVDNYLLLWSVNDSQE